jgi:hypothetical protein
MFHRNMISMLPNWILITNDDKTTHLGIYLLVFLHDKLVTARGCAMYTKP